MDICRKPFTIAIILVFKNELNRVDFLYLKVLIFSWNYFRFNYFNNLSPVLNLHPYCQLKTIQTIYYKEYTLNHLLLIELAKFIFFQDFIARFYPKIPPKFRQNSADITPDKNK